MKKSIQFFLMSFRRKPESSGFKTLRTYWTPVFTGVTDETNFFTPSGQGEEEYSEIFTASLSRGKGSLRMDTVYLSCWTTAANPFFSISTSDA